MSAKYQFFKTPRPGSKEGEEVTLHARIVNGSVVHLDQLCARVARRSTFQEGEVRGVLSVLIDEMIQAMKDGDKVEIDGFGSFYPTLSCPPIADPKEIRAESIHFSRVAFRGSDRLRQAMKGMPIERSPYSSRKATDCPAELRRQKILALLEQQKEIQSSDCMRVNHCSRYMAQSDLKALFVAGNICRLGGPKVAVYVLADKR